MSAGRRRVVPAGLLALGLALPGVVAGSAAQARPAPNPVTAPAPVAAPDDATGPLNGVPAVELARMRREAPLAAAASRIRRAARDGAVPGYTGIALTPTGDGVEVYWKGAPPAEVRKVIDAEARTVPVAVRSARFAKAELDTAVGVVARSVLGKGKGQATSVSYPVTGDGLTVRTSTPAQTRALLPEVAVPVTVEQVPATASRKPSSPAPAKPTSPSPAAAKLTVNAVPPSPSRHDDSVPAWGGAHIINSNATGGNDGWQTRDAYGKVVAADTKWHCTSGIPVRDPRNGTELMVGVANCGRPRQLFVDPTGAAVNDPLAGNDNLVDGASGLMLTRPVGGAEPFIYTGGSWSDVGWSVEKYDYLLANQHVCITGAQTGLMCGAKVTTTIGTAQGWVPNSQGGSDLVVGLTSILMNSAPRPYVLKDGSSCGYNLNDDMLEELNCYDPYIGPGDLGAPIFTIDGGPNTGITVRGIMIRRQQADEPEKPAYVDAQDADKVMGAFTDTLGTRLEILNKNNDQ